MLVKYYSAHQYFYFDKQKYNLKTLAALAVKDLQNFKVINARTKTDITCEILVKLMSYMDLDLNENDLKNLIKESL